jgi:hypothetical protein
MLATASLEGRGFKTLEKVSWAERGDLAIAGAPDGRTIFFANGGIVFQLPIDDGNPLKICPGHSVAVDPQGRYLVTKVNDASARNYLIQYSLTDRTQRRLELPDSHPMGANSLGPNAVGRDGRILVPVAPLDSWFWPAAIFDPGTGKVELATDVQADMYSSGWDDEGRIVTGALFFRSSIWRFRPE